MMLAIAGCGGGGGSGGIGGGAAPSVKHHLQGEMYGGQNPVSGATITLYAAGDSGYGSAASVLASTTTDSNGKWNIASFTCPTPNCFSPETYLVATGGNSGSGTNSAIALMAAMGPCDHIETSTKVIINELTTIAAQWALQQFADSTGKNISAPISNVGGLSNAYATVSNLDEVSSSDLSVSGDQSGFLPTAAQCGAGSPPANCDGLERLNTLADIIAACVNSSGATSTACKTLFCDATPGRIFTGGVCTFPPMSTDTLADPMPMCPTISGQTPTICGPPIPTDTLAASHLIAQNPTHDAAGLFALATPDAPFEPSLASAPDGLEIALNFAPAGAAFDVPTSLALDGSGNLFLTNQFGNSVSELTVASSYATGLNFNDTGSPGAALKEPVALALDGSGNVFVANEYPSGGGNSVSELTKASGYAIGLNFAPSGAAFDQPSSLALDGSGDVFVGNFSSSSVSELTAASSYATGLNFNNSNTGSPGAVFDRPNSIALDGSSNVFVTNLPSNSVSELTEASSYATGLNFAPSGAMFGDPTSIALDGSGDVFTGNELHNWVSELTAPNYATSGSNFAPSGASFSEPFGLALDGSGNMFVTNFTTNSVSELTKSSSYTIGLNFAPSGAAFNHSQSLAVDGSGNIFAANGSGNSVSQLIGLATPVVTPIQSCVAAEKAHSTQYCVP